jgi:integral membrane protein (TIGR00529 family)
MVILLKLKLKLEIVLPIGATTLGLLFGESIIFIIKSWFFIFTTKQFFNLFFIILTVILLGNFMEKTGLLKRMASIFLTIFKDNRIAALASASFIGFLPMPGGALLSAPFIEKLLPNNTKENQHLINYWFRHIWEYFFPLYTAIVWILTVMNADIRKIFIWMFPLTIFMTISGLFFIFKEKKSEINFTKESIFRLLEVSWPILTAVFLSVLLKLPLLLSVFISLILFLSFNKNLIKILPKTIIEIKPIKLIFLVSAILFFGTIVKDAKIAVQLFQNLKNTPAEILLITIPFFVGLLTGISIGFVSISFPILMPFLIQNNIINYPHLLLAYSFGFLGVMLSPSHLCFVITANYFKTTLLKLYPQLLKVAITNIVLATIYYIFLTKIF